MSTPRQSDDYPPDSAHEHVLTPIATAISAVEAERTEVEAERRAYVRFGDRVAGLDTVPRAQTPSRPGARATVVGSRQKGVERLRSAFRETVMSVDHYEEVYDEPLVKHAAAELSAEVAAGFHGETSPGFTELYKAALTRAVSEAVDGRETVCDQLQSELESLERCHTSLERLLSTHSARAPASTPGDVRNQLDELAGDRQQAIQRRYPGSRADGHDLCQYLYQEFDWTYPVLTAITRFRDAMV